MSPDTTLTEVVLPGVVEPDGLIIQERPVPTPGEGQALVEMQAAGVSFAEQGMRRNRYPGQPKFPFVLGYDLVGVVAAVGDGVDPALVGRRVAAVTKTGGWTTHALLDAGTLVPVPDGVDAGRRRDRRGQRRHRLADAAPQGPRAGGPDDPRPRRQRRRRHHAGPARPPRRRAGHRHRIAPPPRRAARAGRRADRLRRPAAGRPRPRARARRRRRRLRPSRRPELQALLRPAGARRDAGRLRHREPARRHQQPGALLHRALRPARAVEPAPQRPPCPLLQLLGRQARDGPSASAGAWPPTSPACCRCCGTAPSRRRSPRTSRCATPARR